MAAMLQHLRCLELFGTFLGTEDLYIVLAPSNMGISILPSFYSKDGASSRQRAVSRFGSGSGSFCTGGLKEVAPCNPAFDEGMEDQCVKGPPVDCELTTWSEWTACSSSCGGGESKRSRALAQEAFNGGFGCQEPFEEVVECAREACHAVHLPVDCVLGP